MLDERTLESGMHTWTARPETNERRPAILVLHGRNGPVEHDGSRDRAERFAQEGFVACVPDLYHRFVGDRGPIERSETRYDPTDAQSLADLDEAVAYLRTLPYVDGELIGIAGFCMSGRISLSFGAAREPAAIAVLHGGAYPRDYAGEFEGQESVANFIPKLTCPVLALFGELDPRVPLENIQRLRNELEQHGKSYQIRIFRDTSHGWLNHRSSAYRRDAAEEAWTMILAFFKGVFAGEWHADQAIWRFGSDSSVDYDVASLLRRPD